MTTSVTICSDSLVHVKCAMMHSFNLCAPPCNFPSCQAPSPQNSSDSFQNTFASKIQIIQIQMLSIRPDLVKHPAVSIPCRPLVQLRTRSRCHQNDPPPPLIRLSAALIDTLLHHSHQLLHSTPHQIPRLHTPILHPPIAVQEPDRRTVRSPPQHLPDIPTQIVLLSEPNLRRYDPALMV